MSERRVAARRPEPAEARGPRVGSGVSPTTGPASRVAGSGPPVEPALLALSAVAVDINRTPVLRGLDLMVPAGQAVGVVGPNGAGKTTLLELLATLRRPRAGRGRVLGADLHREVPTSVRRAICLIGHEPALYPKLTLRENLRFVATLFGQPARMAEQALATVGLVRAADRRLEQCSQGMARRADLARALITRPQLLLLDEPHAGLDQAALDVVGYLTRKACEGGGAAVVVSHDQSRLAVITDRLLALVNGRLVPEGRS